MASASLPPRQFSTLDPLPAALAVYIALEWLPRGATQRELAELLHRAPSTISKSLGMLESAGRAYPTRVKRAHRRGALQSVWRIQA
jgi:predicted transcriptional regulator